jgi:hypothetical protein
MSVLDQNGRILALGFLSWLGPLQVTQPITTFLKLESVGKRKMSGIVCDGSFCSLAFNAYFSEFYESTKHFFPEFP